MPIIYSTVNYFFCDPSEAGVPYDEGEYIVDSDISIEEILLELSLECNEDLFSDIENSFNNNFFARAIDGHWLNVSIDTILRYSWSNFENIIKHKYRYFFINAGDNKYSDVLSPVDLLKKLHDLIIDFDMISIIESGEIFYRARIVNGININKTTLGPPPLNKAKNGRMNPHGISYFYLAKSISTALAETINTIPIKAAIGRFETTDKLHLINLFKIQKTPSIFDNDNRENFELLKFINEFAKTISSPVNKEDDSDILDYIPTQVVSEFFSQQLRYKGKPIDGIMYKSAVHEGGINIVLFPPFPDRYDDFFEKLTFKDGKYIDVQTWGQLGAYLFGRTDS